MPVTGPPVKEKPRARRGFPLGGEDALTLHGNRTEITSLPPLYLFALDKQPGDTMGEVVGDVSVAHLSMQ